MRHNKKGFTLIEMIVVIVIIAILAAVAVPAVMRYIDDARDTKLITHAHSVLTSAKAKSVVLAAHDELLKLDKNQNIWEEIVADADVDGKLEELELNKQKNASGDFILAIGGKYVYYTDETQTFEIRDELISTASFIKKVHDSLVTEEFLKEISDYFTTKTSADSLDSEGVNFGQPLKEKLKKLGFDIDRYSFRIEQSKDKTQHSITITQKKISEAMIGQTVEVTQFDYGRQNFNGTYVKKTGTASVSTKLVDNKDTVPYLDLSNVNWKIEDQ